MTSPQEHVEGRGQYVLQRKELTFSFDAEGLLTPGPIVCC